MHKEKIIQEQLKVSYQTCDRVYEQRHSIKKWAITVWAALLVSILSGKIDLSFCYSLLTIITILLGFWAYDGMIASYGASIKRLAEKQELLLLSGDFDSKDLKKYMLYQSRYFVSKKAKLEDYLSCLFKKETVLIFYILLSLLSVIALGLKFEIFIKMFKTIFLRQTQ